LYDLNVQLEKQALELQRAQLADALILTPEQKLRFGIITRLEDAYAEFDPDLYFNSS